MQNIREKLKRRFSHKDPNRKSPHLHFKPKVYFHIGWYLPECINKRYSELEMLKAASIKMGNFKETIELRKEAAESTCNFCSYLKSTVYIELPSSSFMMTYALTHPFKYSITDMQNCLANFDDHEEADEETQTYLETEINGTDDKHPQGKPGSLLNRLIMHGNKKTEDELAADSAHYQTTQQSNRT